jgi:hypothetical protein
MKTKKPDANTTKRSADATVILSTSDFVSSSSAA